MSETAEYRWGRDDGYRAGFTAGRTSARTDEKKLKARIRQLELQRDELIDQLAAQRIYTSEGG